MLKQYSLKKVILMDFRWIWEPSWPSKTQPRLSRIDVEKTLSINNFLKASWNAIFSAKRRKYAPQVVKMRAAGRNAQPPGEGLGEGSRRFDVKNLALEDWSKDKKTLAQRFSTPSPLGGGSLRAFRLA